MCVEGDSALFDEGASDGWPRGCGREADNEADEAEMRPRRKP